MAATHASLPYLSSQLVKEQSTLYRTRSGNDALFPGGDGRSGETPGRRDMRRRRNLNLFFPPAVRKRNLHIPAIRNACPTANGRPWGTFKSLNAELTQR
jgi:hypothetical protein